MKVSTQTAKTSENVSPLGIPLSPKTYLSGRVRSFHPKKSGRLARATDGISSDATPCHASGRA